MNGYTVPLIPPHLASNIKDCWVVAGNSPDVNPIEKVSLSIQQVGDQLVIVPICSHASPPVATRVDGETGGDVYVEGGVAPATNAGSNGSCAGKSSIEVETLFLQQFILQQRMEDLRQEIISLFGVQRSYLRNMNTNVKRIAAQPVVRSYSKQGRTSGHLSRGGLYWEDGIMDVEETRNGVKLSKNPRDLYVVWKEWEFGLNGTKPARDFTAHERGMNKFAFSWRKNLWDTVTCMIAHGFTSDTAIDRIYLVYMARESWCAPSAMHWLKIGVTKLIGCYKFTGLGRGHEEGGRGPLIISNWLCLDQ